MEQQELDFAHAIPTKRFFVSMLTRDINLDDAILDLIDNCLDGALRSAGLNEVDYSSHKVQIELNKSYFMISDNCGGIPRNIARNYAFKMGRDHDDNRDLDSETIGMYGVGMKRAIFKMGRKTTVSTMHNKDNYSVTITPEWLDGKEWEVLPIVDNVAESLLSAPGTIIRVEQLHSNVSRQFGNDAFTNDLQNAIGEHFTSFLQKGLTIEINEVPVKPIRVEVLVSTNENEPAPYVFKKNISGVNVSIVVGLNTGRGDDNDDDDDDTDFERNRTSATAGWTVFCNDRAVIVGDKSRLTGWGDGIPLYHGQFSIITGIATNNHDKTCSRHFF
jgi:Histidine kinase-, DNA gyrase B-, and HSP90-like ATPase